MLTSTINSNKKYFNKADPTIIAEIYKETTDDTVILLRQQKGKSISTICLPKREFLEKYEEV